MFERLQSMFASAISSSCRRRRNRSLWNSYEALEPRQLLTVLFVDAAATNGDGSAENPFSSIAEAVATAGQLAGDDTIQIAPGIYHERVTINDTSGALTIQGVAGDRSAVVVDGDGNGIDPSIGVNVFSVFPSGNVTFRNLTVTNAGRDGIQQLGIQQPNSQNPNTLLTVDNVASVRNGLSGVSMVYAGALLLLDSDVSNNGTGVYSNGTSEGNGLFSFDASTVTLRNVTANGNRSHGIFAQSNDALNVQSLSASGNTLRAVSSFFNPVVTVTDSQLNRNGLNGLLVQDSTTVNVERTSTNNNLQNVNGVFINRVTTVSLTDVEANANSFHGLGIYNITQSASLKRVTATGNPRSGIDFDVNPALSIIDSVASGNSVGIGLRRVTTARISGTQADSNNIGLSSDSATGRVTVDRSQFNANISNGISFGGSSLFFSNSQANGNLFVNNNEMSAGLLATNSQSVQIVNSQFVNNGGMGVLVDSVRQSLSVSGSTISQNGLSGMWVSNQNLVSLGQPNNATVSVSTSTISGNGVAGVYLTAAKQTTVSGSTITTNGSGRGARGGVRSVSGGDLTIVESTIAGNLSSAGIGGGGVWMSPNVTGLSRTGNFLVQRSTLENNLSEGDGAAIFVNAASATIDSSTIAGNQAFQSSLILSALGGAIYSFQTPVRLVNNTFSGNSASTAGAAVALISAGTTSSFVNNTFLNNMAATAGAIYTDASRAIIQNNIVAGNSLPQFADRVSTNQPVSSQGTNLISDATGISGGLNGFDLTGTSAAPLDPRFGPLANNGGPTKTHRLLPGSPAINAGILLSNFAVPVLDQRGSALAAQKDIGSYENQRPIVQNDTATLNEDNSVQIRVLTNDIETEGEALSVASLSDVTNGAATINADGTVTFTPSANFNGTASFRYFAQDAAGLLSDVAGVVTITVVSVNDVPVARPDAATMGEDGQLTWNVLNNDSDADGDALTVLSVSQPSHGRVEILADNSIRYVPNADYNGSDVVTYLISDGLGGVASSTLSITIENQNDAPVAILDDYVMNEDGVLTFNPAMNDIDVDGDRLTVTDISSVGNATVVLNPDGTITFTPFANQYGLAELTYTVTDGLGGYATSQIFIIINGVNDAPVAANDSITATEDAIVQINPVVNDSDIDGDLLAVSRIVSAPANGAVTVNSDGTVTYIPKVDFAGTDTFTYEVSDGNGGVATATVTLTIVSRHSQMNTLRTDVQALETNGTLNKKNTQQLLANLKFGATDTATISNLQKFQNDVLSLMNQGILSDTIGNDLLFRAQFLIRSVQIIAPGSGKGKGR